MGRPKGGKNQMHTKEEKMKYVKMILDEGYSVWDLEKKYNVSHSLTNLWVKKYIEYGESSLENQKRPGNPLAKYQTVCHMMVTKMECNIYSNISYIKYKFN